MLLFPFREEHRVVCNILKARWTSCSSKRRPLKSVSMRDSQKSLNRRKKIIQNGNQQVCDSVKAKWNPNLNQDVGKEGG